MLLSLFIQDFNNIITKYQVDLVTSSLIYVLSAQMFLTKTVSLYQMKVNSLKTKLDMTL